MKSLKKFNLFIVSVLLIVAGLFFASCGKKDYSSISITSDVAEITMDIGESRVINFKIEKFSSGMSGRLNISAINNTGCISYEVSDPRSGVTTVSVEALSGGTTSLRAVSVEGNKECIVTINVRQYSSSLGASDERLFVSDSSAFVPSPSHFVFDSNATEKALSYYFYGTIGVGISGENLTLESVKDGDEYINEFVSVRMENAEDKNYLIFTDSLNKEYTISLGTGSPTTGQNQRYSFIELIKEGDSYDFTGAVAVSLGNKFTFIAKYNEEVYAQRDFYVMPDIISEPITWDYGYAYGSDYTNIENTLSKLILVPNRQEQAVGGAVIDYSRARLNVNIPSVGDNIRVDYRVENSNLISMDRINADVASTTYQFQIAGKTSIGAETKIIINIYYDGFADSNDQSVNYRFEIPVEIKFEPKNITINGGGLVKQTFYNNYLGNFGWQDYRVYIAPDTCSYDQLRVIFNHKEVMIKYDDGELVDSSGAGSFPLDDGSERRYIIVNDLTKPIQIKGVNGATETENGTVEFALIHNLLGIKEDMVTTSLNYEIKAGATKFGFLNSNGDYNEADEEYFKNNGIYLALNSASPINFDLLSANATFTNVDFTYRPTDGSKDVVNLTFDRAGQGGTKVATLKVTPKALGYGTYVIRLDNGLAKEVTFRVIESLESVTVGGGYDTSAITKLSVEQFGAEVFILSDREDNNLVQTSARLELYANGSKASTAMLVDRVQDSLVGNGFTYSYSSNVAQYSDGNYLDLTLTTAGNGHGSITFDVKGYEVFNFRRSEKTIRYTIDVVSYSLINKLNVVKTKDGNGSYLDDEGEAKTPANYVYVYKLTNNMEPRTAKLQVFPRFDGFLFRNPNSRVEQYAWERETFDNKYVYWTIPGGIQIFINGHGADRMVYDPNSSNNTYVIGEYGVFDTKTMTFTANQNAVDFNFDLIAHVEQYDKTFSFPVNIQAFDYSEVKDITVQPVVVDNSLNFSIMESGRKKELIVYTSPSDTTNSTIVVQFLPNNIEVTEDGQVVNKPINLFGEYNAETGSYEGLLLKQIDKTSWLISMDVSYFINNNKVIANSSTQSLSGTLIIAAADWLDASGNVKNEYLGKRKRFTINFANGTKGNPFYLETAQDVLNIKDALNAHYRLSTTIDFSQHRDKLPLGKFTGSLVGTNDYAKISGLVNNSQQSGQLYYGLFTEVARQKKLDANGNVVLDSEGKEVEDLDTGLIANINFEGNINLTNVENGANIGIVTGVNKGTLRNLSVSVTANSAISLLGAANIGYVAGKNEGEIVQDYTVQNFMPKILVYTGDFGLRVVPADTFSPVYVGGVTGLNNGSIVKTDAPNLKLYGYSQYLAYANVTITRPNVSGQITFNKEISLANAVGVIAGYSTSGSSIVGQGYRNDYGVAPEISTPKDYNFGEGILIGGRAEGTQYVGGAVGYFEGSYTGTSGGNYMKSVTDEYGVTTKVAQLEFNGITSRVNVYGYSFTKEVTVGAIAGHVEKVAFLDNILSDLAVQAIDAGKTGINASMVVRYLTSLGHTTTDSEIYDEAGNVKESYLNVITFGSLPSGELSRSFINESRMVRYIKRNYVDTPAAGQNDIIVESQGDTFKYYGDFVEICEGVTSDDQRCTVVANQFQFRLDESNWFVKVNEANGFKSFVDSEGNVANNVFYAYYFSATGVAFSQKEQDILDAQVLLDQYLNYVSPMGASSSLYPIVSSNGLIFTSENPDVLTFNQAGIITVRGNGQAKVNVASLLNENDKLVIYINVVNYFNSDEDMSIVYPDLADNSIPVDASTITLKGTNSVTLYVKPNYSLQFGKQENGFYEISVDSLGTLQMVGGLVINLAPNSNIEPFVTYNYDLVDSEGNPLSYFTQREGTTALEGEIEEISILHNGQTVSFRKKTNSKEGRYALSIKTRIKTDIIDGKEYFCYVNKNIKDTTLVFTKGAETINAKNYDELTIATSKRGEDYIIINSPSVESKPRYVIYKVNENGSNGDVLQGTYPPADIEQEANALFNVSFSPEEQSTFGKQEFLLNIEVNKNSEAYIYRHLNNIYGRYRLYIYADSDPSKYIITELHLVNMDVSNITVNNYPNLQELEQSVDFSTSSDKAVPGKTGLIMINVTPEDADFDYIEVVNTELANVAGNGKASFNLVAKYADKRADGKLFDEQRISGSTFEGGIRLYQNDIINLYANTQKVEGPTGTIDKNLYEFYHGIIYLNYNIPTFGVLDESLTQFKITIYKNGKPVYDPCIVTLTNNLSYQATVTINGKKPIKGEDDELVYQVARGLKYKLDLDYFGFSFENISLISSSPEKAAITYENGSYYLNITSDPFDYSLNDVDGFPISIVVNAEQMVDEELRKYSSKTNVRVLEYVLDYHWEEGLNWNERDEMLDIVSNMDEGVINIQVGNKQTLSVDVSDLIEFDATNSIVVDEVKAFMRDLSNNGSWRVYTNLNDANMQVVDKNKNPISVTTYPGGIEAGGLVKPKGYETAYSISPTGTLSNMYFEAQGLEIKPAITHDVLDSYYVFSFDAHYGITRSRGVYNYSSDSTDNRIYTEFRFNVFQSSSEESPIPIYSYEDLKNMQSGAYYILMTNDIVLDSSFTPIEAQVAYFDGNGYTIHMNGVYSVEGQNLGLFSSVAQNSIIKNLNIALSGDTIFSTTASDFSFGLITGQNAGNIYNCYVYSEKSSVSAQGYFLSVESKALDGNSYVAGIAGHNTGNITNSRSSINISSTFNVAGLVGTNSGKIASSYFKDGILIGTTQSNHRLGGLVVHNAESGQIITSYVSGSCEARRVYSNDTRHYLSATSPEGGFAYSNSGSISDCYSNISMQGYSTMAGFVFENGGIIRNSFSLSVLIDNVISSAGFSMNGVYDSRNGTFENCYYFSHISRGASDNVGNINTSLANVSFTGVRKLDIEEFGDLEKYFGEYSYTKNITNNTVWYLSDGGTAEMFNNVQFNGGRLELVAPNIVAFSQQYLFDTIEDETTGDVRYEYRYTNTSDTIGSIKNPYIIDNPKNFERNIITPATKSGYNYNHYRLVADIDYGKFDGLSQLYKVSLAGSLEGNGMKISQISLLSQAILPNAGLFAQIGRNVMNQGSVMNLTLSPREVNFTNVTCVGALAGTLAYGYIYNVNVETDEELVVTGKNFVAGVIGRAIDNYVIKNVTSNLSASSSYLPVYDDQKADDETINSYSQNLNNLDTFSYAGSVVGFAGGNGQINRVNANNVLNVRADRVGVALGGIGSNATVNYVYIDLNSNLKIRSSRYAGFAVGEVKGTLKYVDVSSISPTASAEFVSLSPEFPLAFGGIAGIINDADVSQVRQGQAFKIKQESNKRVNFVGGIAGRVIGDSRLSESIVEGNMQACSTLGGIAGNVKGGLRIDQVAVKADSLVVEGTNLEKPCVGGFIGQLDIINSVHITNSYTNSNLKIDTSVYGVPIEASVGAFIGGGNPHRMSYCYSTGNIVVDLKDLRGGAGQHHKVSSLIEKSTTDNKLSFVEDIVDGLQGKVQYEKNIQKGNFDHVYFYGTKGGVGGTNVFSSYSNMIEYWAQKYRNNNITLYENIHGYGSYEFASNINLSASECYERSALNNIFNGAYLNLISIADNKVQNSLDDSRQFVLSIDPTDGIEKYRQLGATDSYYAKFDEDKLIKDSRISANEANGGIQVRDIYLKDKYVKYTMQTTEKLNGNKLETVTGWFIDETDLYKVSTSNKEFSIVPAYSDADFVNVVDVYMNDNNDVYYAVGRTSTGQAQYYVELQDGELTNKYYYSNGTYINVELNTVLNTNELRTGFWSTTSTLPTLSFEQNMIWLK